jgi:dUTP pyrophosphatase
MPRKKKNKYPAMSGFEQCRDVVKDCRPEPLAVKPDGESTVEVPYFRSPPLEVPKKEEPMIIKGSLIVNVKKINCDARLPEKKSESAAAFDLYALEDTLLQPGKITAVRTGLSIELPTGMKGEIYSRSGLAKRGIYVANQPGKIDEDYRGEVLVLLKYDDPAIISLIDNIRKALVQFTKDFVSSNQFTIDEAKKRLRSKLEPSSLKPYEIKAGDRIAQFEIQKVESVVFKETDKLSDTKRGRGGMGSTGT